METSRHLTRFTGATILATTTLAATTAHADQVSGIKKKGELVCGVPGTDEPFNFLKDPMNHEIVDYDVGICDATAKSLDVKPVLRQPAVATHLPELQQGRVDLLAAPFTHNKEREMRINFSVSTFITGRKTMVEKSNGITSLA